MIAAGEIKCPDNPNGNAQNLECYPIVRQIRSKLVQEIKAKATVVVVDERHDTFESELMVKGVSYVVPTGHLEDRYVRISEVGFIADCENTAYGSICGDSIKIRFQFKEPSLSKLSVGQVTQQPVAHYNQH